MRHIDQMVLTGTTLLGAVAGVIGSFAVLRRRALVGDVLSHAALPGLCIAMVIMGGMYMAGMLVGALISGMIGIVLITVICRWTRTKEDAALGIILSTFFGFGLVLKSIIPNNAGIDGYIWGSVVGIIPEDLITIGICSVMVLVLLVLFYKEFKLFSFDPHFAQSLGWPIFLLDMLMMGSLAIVTVNGLPAVGVVLMSAMLITPGATARFWTNRLGMLLILSCIIGAATGFLGSLLTTGLLTQWIGFDPLAFGSKKITFPPGPVIVLCGSAIFIFSMLFAPERGIIARVLVHFRFKRRTANENLLRTMYELSESSLPELVQIPHAELFRKHSWGNTTRRWLLSQAVKQELINVTANHVQLTQQGLQRAIQITRAHRLWELFLIQGANIAPDHVDRDADAIEHLLPVELVEQIEASLAINQQLEKPQPEESQLAIPTSPHKL